MIKEKSCGAVIYKVENNERFYLLSKMGLGHVSLTKGHVENNETELETALREISEETSLTPVIDTNFREVITYSPNPGIIKDVVFFVAEVENGKEPIDSHDNEVVGYLWLKFDEALLNLTYDSDKEVLRKANKYLEEK